MKVRFIKPCSIDFASGDEWRLPPELAASLIEAGCCVPVRSDDDVEIVRPPDHDIEKRIYLN